MMMLLLMMLLLLLLLLFGEENSCCCCRCFPRWKLLFSLKPTFDRRCLSFLFYLRCKDSPSFCSNWCRAVDITLCSMGLMGHQSKASNALHSKIYIGKQIRWKSCLVDQQDKHKIVVQPVIICTGADCFMGWGESILRLYVTYYKYSELIDWLIDWLTDWLIDWLTDWLIDWWLIDWLTDWLTDW